MELAKKFVKMQIPGGPLLELMIQEGCPESGKEWSWIFNWGIAQYKREKLERQCNHGPYLILKLKYGEEFYLTL